jgi:dihydropteroate synthase
MKPASPTLLMGIVNVTPDSFFDGGRHASLERAVAHARRLADEGAAWIDVGGESTRPGAGPLPPEVELERVLPVIRALGASSRPFRVSVDTRRASVAAAALAEGADGVNDVSALSDPDMARVIGDHGCHVFLMHMRGTPETMQRCPRYHDVVAEVSEFLLERAALALARGLPRERVWLDPGIGFGKTLDHNLALIAAVPSLASLGHPLLLGASRKSFIGQVLGLPEPADRLEGSLGVAAIAAWTGCTMLRVHDVRASRRALDMVDALRGVAAPPAPPVPASPC